MRASVLFFGLLLGLVVVALADFDKPTLLWSLGGSCGYNCQRGWYSSPAVATDPVTGEKLIVSAAYDVYCMYGNGTTKWSAQSPGGGRVWPGIVIVDLDKDGKLEGVVAFGGGYVSAYNLTDGAIYYPNFPYKPSGVDDEFRALAVADINQDAGMEILLGRAYSGNTNTYGLTYYGSPLPGYPLGTDQSKGYTWGVYNSNLGIADMDNDGKYEVISPSDVHYVCVYYADGTPYPCNSQYAANGGRTNWGQVGFYYNVTWENQGYGPCDSAADAAIRTNFANGPVVVADLDNDGTNEYVFTGRTYYCNDESPAFVGIHITNADRTRYKNAAKGYDWTTLPDPATGKPLAIGDYDTIEDTQFNAAVGNLDGDSNGELEIVYPGWDGKMYAHWLDKNPRGVWPFDMKSLSSTSSIVFGTEPAIVDIDNDGKAEVIFGTWTTKTSGDFGYLVILDSSGNLVYKIPLDEPLNSNAQWNGILACPTVANIDSDPNLEVVVLSAYSGTLAYRLHNSTNAKIHWGTSRGNQQRTASVTLPTVGPGSPPPASINSGVSTLIASWVAVVEYLLRFVL